MSVQMIINSLKHSPGIANRIKFLATWVPMQARTINNFKDFKRNRRLMMSLNAPQLFRVPRKNQRSSQWFIKNLVVKIFTHLAIRTQP